MGKYTAAAKRLPRPEESPLPEWLQEALDAIPAEDRTPGGLIERYNAAKAEKAKLADEEKAVNKRIAALDVLLVKVLRDQGLESVRGATGGLVTLHPDIRVRVTDRDAVRSWAKENGHERDLNLNTKTLEGIAKALFDEAGEVVDGVTLEPFDKIHYRK